MRKHNFECVVQMFSSSGAGGLVTVRSRRFALYVGRTSGSQYSGGRLCTLIGVPWRGVGFSTLSTGRFVLKQHIRKGAESAEHDETAGYTYEGTQTTA